jgi:hypothetical protein
LTIGLVGALGRAPRAATIDVCDAGVLGCTGELELASAGDV